MSYQIVVVEDEPLLRELYARALSLFTDDLTVFSNGLDALEHIETQAPHLMILDVNLPGMSGINIIKHARLRLGLESTKIIAATANIIALQNPYLHLADAVLEKPLTVSQLVSTCENLLGVFRITEELPVLKTQFAVGA